MTEMPKRDRVDRLRNRERILSAARTAFSDADATNSPVSLEGVARSAGVGIATLYRHFPTREKLADAVYLRKLDELTDAAHFAGSADGAAELTTWMSSYIAFMRSKRSMLDTVRAAWLSGASVKSEVMERVTSTVEAFLVRGAKDRSLRSDLRAEDVTVVLLGLLTAPAAEDDGAQTARLLELLLHGVATANAPD